MIDSSGLIVVGAVIWLVHKTNAKRRSTVQKPSVYNKSKFSKATFRSTGDVMHASILPNLKTQTQTVVGRFRPKNLPEAL